MSDNTIRVAELENKLEADLLSQILQDRNVEFAIMTNPGYIFGIYLGAEPADGLCAHDYAAVYGFTDDREAILQALAEIRASQPLADDVARLLKPKMWKIKRRSFSEKKA